MIQSSFILLALLSLMIETANAQTLAVFTPVSTTFTHMGVGEQFTPLFNTPTIQTPVLVTPTVVLTATIQPTFVSQPKPATPDNFQSMSDLHKEALGQTVSGSDKRPTTPPVNFEKDFFDQNHFQISVGGGVDFLSQNFNTTDRIDGVGGQIGIGYLLNDRWSLWLTENYFYFSPTEPYAPYGPYDYARGENDFWETVLSIRYTFGGSFIKPYLTLGGGVLIAYSGGDLIYANDPNDDIYEDIYTAPVLQVGLGLQMPLDSGMDFFVEAKCDFIFQTVYQFSFDYYDAAFKPEVETAVKFPVNAGVAFNLFGDEHITRTPTPVPTPTAVPAENWFVKIGGGPSLNSQINEYGNYSPNSGFMSSLAGGIDFPSGFSLFASVDQLSENWGLLGNLQYTLPLRTHFVSPYFYAGFGMVFMDNGGANSSTTCLQFGLGSEFHLNPQVAWFVEANVFAAQEDIYPTADYGTLLTGLKIRLPMARDNSAILSKSTGDGEGFAEIAGAADTTAENWQPAYTAANGLVFGAGYEFKDGWAFQMDVENFYFSGMNFLGPITDDVVRILPTIRRHLSSGFIRPYVLVGVGTEIEISNSLYGDATVAYLDAAAGLGVDVRVDDRLNLFAEGKYNFVFAYGVVGQDIPILTGVRFGL